MKVSHLFTLFIVLFLGIMFAVEYNMPKTFVWSPTFSHYDKQPFGCAVFDSLLSSSLPSGYSVSRKTFYQFAKEDTTHQRGILLITKEVSLSRVDVEALLKMAERGNKVMLVGGWFGMALEDTLGFGISNSHFSSMSFKKYASLLLAKDTICWVGDSIIYPRQEYYFYPQFSASCFWKMDSLHTKVLAEKCEYANKIKNNSPIAITYPCGKGEIILVSTPLLFTNYGVLDRHNATYVFRLLTQMKELPIVRTEGYMKQTAQQEQSPFRYLLSQPPLRWALYLTMLTVLLFILFTARRRQRVIPLIGKPDNKSLEFAELIGTLYYQKKDHADLVCKKFSYFAEVLRRVIQVDIEDEEDDERSFLRIAQKTGMDIEELKHFIYDVRPIATGRYGVSEVEMRQYIDKMNEIINHI